MIEIELKELEKIKDGLEEAEAKIRKFWRIHDKGDDESDDALEGLNMLDEAVSYIDSWLEDDREQTRADEQRLNEWTAWAKR